VRGTVLWLLTACSGFACLIYQILWMRQAGLLFGNTAHAVALTLAVFFGGLAMGGWFWGKRSRQLANPLRSCAWVELGVAASGSGILIAPAIVPGVVALLHDDDGGGFALGVFKFLATLFMVFPASFLMGGTLPLLGQAFIRDRATFGTIAARMYAANTFGATLGAFAAAFVLIGTLGIRMTCLTAIAGSVVTAIVAFWLSKNPRLQVAPGEGLAVKPPENPQRTKRKRAKGDVATAIQKLPIPRGIICGLAGLSGFNLLALEVVWTRMLAQVHENSVYSFATVLIVVLGCLALGAWIAARLVKGGGGVVGERALLWLIAIGGAALAVTPLMATGLGVGLTMLSTDYSFTGYTIRLFITALAIIGPACLPLGAVLPLLMKSEEAFLNHAGGSIGTLSAVNTACAVVGSLTAGFLFMEWLGTWRTVQLLSAVYLLVALIVPSVAGTNSVTVRIFAGIMLIVTFTVLVPSPTLQSAGGLSNGVVLEKWEGSDSTVDVFQDSRGDVSIRVNANYSLGSWGAYGSQMFQARIPLLAWSETDSLFFLGMGTGVTAGEALSRDDFPGVQKVVACELLPAVVAASKKYFTTGPNGFDLTNGLHSDPRARIVVADGRNRLLTSRTKYAMINADLFLPYQRGTGGLYSREHFRTVRERLKPGGVFVQWLPLYQISEREFGIIARTMLDVFPQVSLWRGNFQPGAEIAAVVGHADKDALPASAPDDEEEKRRAVENATYIDLQRLLLPINQRTIPLFYGGNLTRCADLFAMYPLNTDDRPMIEFGTPRSLHQPSGAPRPHFVEGRFAKLVDHVQQRTPPSMDPLLSLRTATARKLPLAGSAFHRAWIARVQGDEIRWKREWETFLMLWLGLDSK
jgi:spermidine synthase